MIYAVEQSENCKYKVKTVLKRLKNDNFDDYNGDLQLYNIRGLVIISFDSYYTMVLK